MNLSTIRRKKLKHAFSGQKLYVSNVLFKPIVITNFEIAGSSLHVGKEMLVAQVNFLSDDGKIQTGVLFTESYSLIDSIRNTESDLPHTTKIIRKSDRYYYFCQLNKIELSKLKTII